MVVLPNFEKAYQGVTVSVSVEGLTKYVAVVRSGDNYFKIHGKYAEVDAPIEEQLRYRRLLSVRERLKDRQLFIEIRKSCNLPTYHHVKRLERAYAMGTPEWKACRQLLTTQNFRSSFRESCCKQLRDWLNDPQPKYLTPFSYKQLMYLVLQK